MHPADVPAGLAELSPGTRIRLFWIEQGDRYAATGTLVSAGPSVVRIASEEGGELSIPVSAVNCFYLPKPRLTRAGWFARFALWLEQLRQPEPRDHLLAQADPVLGNDPDVGPFRAPIGLRNDHP